VIVLFDCLICKDVRWGRERRAPERVSGTRAGLRIVVIRVWCQSCRDNLFLAVFRVLSLLAWSHVLAFQIVTRWLLRPSYLFQTSIESCGALDCNCNNSWHCIGVFGASSRMQPPAFRKLETLIPVRAGICSAIRSLETAFSPGQWPHSKDRVE
jgi:hypothetical protein